jgi:hypothetical protein
VLERLRASFPKESSDALLSSQRIFASLLSEPFSRLSFVFALRRSIAQLTNDFLFTEVAVVVVFIFVITRKFRGGCCGRSGRRR